MLPLLLLWWHVLTHLLFPLLLCLLLLLVRGQLWALLRIAVSSWVLLVLARIRPLDWADHVRRLLLLRREWIARTASRRRGRGR